jgi:hypothetical protein
MSKFLITKNPPTTLEKNEFIISAPNFMPEIAACRLKKPKSNLLTANYLREVVAAIGLKYMGEDFDALRSLNISRYIGVPCDTEEQIHDTLVKAFVDQLPELLYAVVYHQFKQRPIGTSLIYYTGDSKYCTKLIELGLEQISQKELEAVQPNKPKKIVGKPAITAEQAARLNENLV